MSKMRPPLRFGLPLPLAPILLLALPLELPVFGVRHMAAQTKPALKCSMKLALWIAFQSLLPARKTKMILSVLWVLDTGSTKTSIRVPRY